MMLAGALRERAGSARALISGRRERRILLVIAGSLIAKLISVLTLLVTVPWTLQYLGAERYGMWVTLSSFSALLSVADLGVGNGLMTALARASGRDDLEALRRLASNGFAAMLSVAVGGAILLLPVVWLVDWPALFNVTSPLARSEAAPAARMFVTCLLLGIPTSLGQRLFMGLQRGALNGLWASASSVAALVAVIVAIRFGLSLPILVFCFVGVPVVMGAIATLWAVSRDGGALVPRISDVVVRETLALGRSGLMFLGLQLIAAVTYSTDNLVIAQALGAAAVAPFSVADRLFGLIAVVMIMINAPLWPAYAEASSRGDVAWVRTTFRRSMAINVVLTGGAALALLVFGGWLIGHWVHNAVAAPFALLLALACRRVIEGCVSACSMLLNGLHEIRFQLYWGVAMAASSVALRILFVHAIGVAGSAWAVTVAVLLFGLLPNLIHIPRVLRRIAVAEAAVNG